MAEVLRDPDDILARVAIPGDPALDIDVDGLTLTAVVVEDRHVMLRLTGGFGAWVSTGGDVAVFPPGDPTAGVDNAHITAWLPDMPTHLFAQFVTRLEGWRDRAVPLRLCGAPGKAFTLIEDRDTFLPLPRRPFPEGDPDG